MQWLLTHDDFKEQPVDILTFCNDGNYLNLWDYRNSRSKVRPKIIWVLNQIFPYKKGDDDPFEWPYQEVTIAGGIGIGKSFVVSIILTYLCYLLGCLKHPQEFFNMTPGSLIQLMNMANNEIKARKIVFSEVKARIDHSPWFKNRFHYDSKTESELRFPNQILIIPGNSQDTFFEGFNIFGGVVDEADSHVMTPDKDCAQIGFDAIKERIRSRFGFKGLVMVIGSPKTIDGFLMRRVKECEESELCGSA